MRVSKSSRERVLRQSVLVLNCGSSSVKFALFDSETEDVFLSGIIENPSSQEALIVWETRESSGRKPLTGKSLVECVGEIVRLLPDDSSLQAIGHRFVHGGEAFSTSVQINDEVLERLRRSVSLAPLHNPANLSGIQATQEAFPELPQVVVFDTAFHQTLPSYAYLYAVPYDWYSEYGVRRYGFHGTSYRYIASRTAQLLKKEVSAISVVVAHLGNGCSACAIEAGQSVDTTMGISPLEGLVMGTRSGDIDPALHGFIATAKGWSIDRVIRALNEESGLLGISGKTHDMRRLIELAELGDERALLAIEVFAYRLAKGIMGLTAALSKLDAIVFTGGIGENSAKVRARTVEHLRVLGVKLDPSLNAQNGDPESGRISSEQSIPCLVVATNEELMIARETLAALDT